jgi:glycosyltransferase involved in cell wall biosynthesis
MSDAIWVTWENQIRNRSMASGLKMKLYQLIFRGPRLRRYVMGMIKTSEVVIREKPRTLFVQNPSLILAMYSLLLRMFLRCKLVIDAHYFGIIAPNENRFLQKVLDVCNRNADMVIVTNSNHYKMVEAVGGNPFICQDPLPALDRYSREFSSKDTVDKKVLFICSFDIDEPFFEVFRAFEELTTEGYSLYVSGNYKKQAINPAEFKHVHFLGYVPSVEFYYHLFSSSVVVDLTTYEDCLVCGAYESMVAEKPLVATDTKAIREYFTNGVIYTAIEREAIAGAVRNAYRDRGKLITEIKHWKAKAMEENRQKVREIRRVLGLRFLG